MTGLPGKAMDCGVVEQLVLVRRGTGPDSVGSWAVVVDGGPDRRLCRGGRQTGGLGFAGFAEVDGLGDGLSHRGLDFRIIDVGFGRRRFGRGSLWFGAGVLVAAALHHGAFALIG